MRMLPEVDPLTELILLDEEISRVIEENEVKNKESIDEASKLSPGAVWCNATNQGREYSNLLDLLNKRHSLRVKINKRKKK